MILKNQRKIFFNFLNLLRFWEWQDKIQTITVAVIVLFIIFPEYLSTILLWQTVIFLGYLFPLFSYGYLINSWADRKEDLAVGKEYYHGFSEEFIKILLVILFVISLVIPLYFNNLIVFGAVFSGLFLATAYSVRPLRYKTKGIMGLLVASFTQRYPFLFYLVIMPDAREGVSYLFGWLVLIGFIIETAHQVGDYFNDQKINLNTFAVEFGIIKTKKIIYFATLLLPVYFLFWPIWQLTIESVLAIVVLIIFSFPALYYAGVQISYSEKKNSL